jgi:signal transduction histidine kinase
LGNAVKFHRPDTPPRVRVEAFRDGDFVRFAIADNGIGIDAQYREDIFTIFKRLHPGETYPGTGIGLAICKRIVDRHGGRIWVEPGTGGGCVFLFTLPTRADSARQDETGETAQGAKVAA